MGNSRETTFEQLLEDQGYLVYTNVGVSMMPLLRQGKDLMIIRKRPEGRLKPMDAVLFRRDNGQYVLHRIVKLLPDGYDILGDNCLKSEYVREEQVLGVLSAVERNGRRIESDSRRNRLYVALWCRPYRLRTFLLRCKAFARRKLSQIYHFIKADR